MPVHCLGTCMQVCILCMIVPTLMVGVALHSFLLCKQVRYAEDRQ